VIVGVGVDVVDVARFEAALERTPALRARLFTEIERDLPPASLAARFAVKEAVAKAMASPGGMLWHDVWVPASGGRPPELHVEGTVKARADAMGIARFHLSISHDAGIAAAVVIAES
jgi:holo-[acyl-carrier protein] synthase